jgi:predicted Zn finger-like uncharacterized protein
MRLSCPNCDAEYDVADGMVPAAGRHVQCTACHTRWFARGEAAPAPSEDQIVARLESRIPRLAAAAKPSGADEPSRDTGDATPEPAPVARDPIVPLRPAGPAKPADRPAVPLPGAVSSPAPPRVTPRLDLGPAPATAWSPPVEPEPRGRFGLGVALALVLFLLALGAYDFRRDVADALPAAGPALEGYADAIDDLRDQLERRLARLRERVDAAAG